MEPFLEIPSHSLLYDGRDDGKISADCFPDDHCCVGLLSRLGTAWSIIRLEEIDKRCRLKVMLANISIAKRLPILNDVKDVK